ncbi:Tanc2 [Symbiodinium pilosum]|uniref:Tanc2 protein n=1 Tax=Symbiodinium pilosum TaxID=2952 RepID=A0A812X8B9_SYMPI|nr:Tanc2 [Symbiodinium pilosum]
MELEELLVSRGASIKSLKQHLQVKLVQSRYRMQLAHNGRLLRDDELLGDLRMPADLQLVLLPLCRGRAEELVEAAITKMADEVEALLAVRQDPNETAWVGSTALVAAAGSGRMQIISALIDAGADRNQTDHNGRSPLWAAAENGHLDAVRYLIAAGADTEKADKHGSSPLSVASENGHLEVVRCLSDAGAQDEKPDECPQCSFWLSAMLCTAEAAGMLSTAGASLGLSCVIAQMMRWKLFSGA